MGYIPVLLAAALIVYAIIAGGYFVALAGFALIYAIFVIGLNIFMGYAGQASFGQNAFAAIGGYTSAVLRPHTASRRCSALVVGVAGAVVCAVVIGYPTLRLKGHYLAMATLAHRPHHLRDHGPMAVGDPRLHGHSGIPPLGIGGSRRSATASSWCCSSVLRGLCMARPG